MIKLNKSDYECLEYELTLMYDGCPLNEDMISSRARLASKVGEVNQAVYDLLSNYRGQYCDDAATEILKQLEVIDD